MSMSISYEETGRTRQKGRTRAGLVSAARTLMAEGTTPTVEQAAAEAAVARATAYRYFPNQRSLLAAAAADLTQPSLLGDDPPADPEARLEIVVDAITRQSIDHETELRNMLRLSLEPDPGRREELPFRKGRRILWVGEALEPQRRRLGDDRLERLVHAIAASVGIDSLVWLTDIAGLSRREAAELMRWSALALLRATLDESGTT